MRITQPGRYRLLQDFPIRGTLSVGTIPQGTVITISQANMDSRQVIGPELGDWHYYEIPCEAVGEEEPR